MSVVTVLTAVSVPNVVSPVIPWPLMLLPLALFRPAALLSTSLSFSPPILLLLLLLRLLLLVVTWPGTLQ